MRSILCCAVETLLVWITCCAVSFAAAAQQSDKPAENQAEKSVENKTSSPPGPVTIENDLVRIVLGEDGRCKSLVEKATGRDWLRPSPGHFFYIKKEGKTFAGTKLARDGDELTVQFGDSGVSARYSLTVRPRYFVVGLQSIEGDGVEEISLGRLEPAIDQNIGWWLSVRWNNEFACCALGLSDRVNTVNVGAIVYREFGMTGQQAAFVAVPTKDLLDVIEQIQQQCNLPSPRIGGHWAKRSPDVRRGYLFVDMTEHNVDEAIRYAKLGEFGYIMTYDGTWASSLGSYPINLKNFPRGEESLKATIDKCHAAGLKVGMHMLTSFVGKNDPLVRPKPDPRLLKDAEAVLAADIDEHAQEIPSATALDHFPLSPAFYGDQRQGLDILIDDEIIHYRQIDHQGRKFLRCVRGFAGTKAASHKAGAKIYHLVERYGCYLVDLRTSLKDELAERVAGVFNRCGFDMIYFDGGECNVANGPFWYWVSQQQMAIYNRIRRDILVQGSGGTPWTWHIFARGACDDFAAVAVKQYLDYHKIADSWMHYARSFMPAELGWWGFFDDQPNHPATTIDEVEYYAIRMIALDTPVSLETHIAALKRHGRTDELLELLGRYERLRLSGKVPPEVRKRLREGEWRLVDAPQWHFRPIGYHTQRVSVPGEFKVTNTASKQPLRFRLQAAPKLAAPGEATNIVLLKPEKPLELQPPEPKAPMPGALAAASIDLTQVAAGSGTAVSGTGAKGVPSGRPLNLVKHRGLAVRLRVDELPPAERPAVLNVQLEAANKTYRDHYIDLNFTGEKVVILPEPTTERMLPEFRPAHANYAFKAAMYSNFHYQNVAALNFRWMRISQPLPRCSIISVEALAESDSRLENPAITCRSQTIVIPAVLTTGDIAEYTQSGTVKLFDRNWNLQKTVAVEPAREDIVLSEGENQLRLDAADDGEAKLTIITLGDEQLMLGGTD